MSESFSARGFFVHTPCGPRKSGMPDSVEIPAPVSATMRAASRTQRRTSSSVAPFATLDYGHAGAREQCRGLEQRQSDHARVAAFEPRNERRGTPLHGIGAGLVERLAGCDVT